jgi:hypothetical protein
LIYFGSEYGSSNGVDVFAAVFLLFPNAMPSLRMRCLSVLGFTCEGDYV